MGQFTGLMRKMPDLERILKRLFTYSVKQKFVVMFSQNVSFQKLKELKLALKSFQESILAI